MSDVRPLRPGDVEAAEEMAWSSLWTMAATYEPQQATPERTPDVIARSRRRIAHLQDTDPEGAWVGVDGDAVVGIALSLRRGPMWFLSLLAVATDVQAQGLGKRLLDASLRTAEDAGAAWILATMDPKALRRYALAGFALHPGYSAKGTLDRSLLPADLRVRDGDWDRDGQLVDDVVTGLRGAPYGPDKAVMAATTQLIIAEDGVDRGYAAVRGGGLACLGATTPVLAQRLLWAALAASDKPDVSVDWLSADQQWAIDVALSARLSLLAGSSSCRRSTLGPLTPYLPGGAFG
jgi:predicted N-acetyltransferase YhbS